MTYVEGAIIGAVVGQVIGALGLVVAMRRDRRKAQK